MGYRVKTLYESDKFPEMQLICGQSGIDRNQRYPDYRSTGHGKICEWRRTSADKYEGISEYKRTEVYALLRKAR